MRQFSITKTAMLKKPLEIDRYFPHISKDD